MGFAYSFGLLFFGATVSWTRLPGPLLMLAIALIPTSVHRANRWLLIALIAAYLPDYLERLGLLFPFDQSETPGAVLLAVEPVIILFALWFFLRRE